MAMSKTQKKAAEKVALYTSLLKLGQPKKIAMKEVRKQFKSGLDSSTCSDAARKLGITNGQMKSRAIQHNLALKTAKLVKAPKTAEVSVSTAVAADVAELIKEEMRRAKDSGSIFIFDVAKLEEDIKRLQSMAAKMQPHGYTKLVVTGDHFEIDQQARVITGKL